jgi:hypothetical protein
MGFFAVTVEAACGERGEKPITADKRSVERVESTETMKNS